MKLRNIAGLMGLLVLLSPTAALADHKAKAELRGFEEVPAVSSTGIGRFNARIDKAGTMIDYELSYMNLEGTASAAHIHFGQRGVNGGVSARLCGGGGKPLCPVSGTVTGVIFAGDVIGPAGQGIAAGELAELIAAMQSRIAYINVHTSKHPGGEIRGQIK